MKLQVIRAIKTHPPGCKTHRVVRKETHGGIQLSLECRRRRLTIGSEMGDESYETAAGVIQISCSGDEDVYASAIDDNAVDEDDVRGVRGVVLRSHALFR